jgi:hypothetical protein
MYHTIEFASACVVDLETSPKNRLERTRVRCGTRLSAALRPFVRATDHGMIEMADIYLADGTALREVPYEWFRFLD